MRFLNREEINSFLFINLKGVSVFMHPHRLFNVHTFSLGLRSIFNITLNII